MSQEKRLIRIMLPGSRRPQEIESAATSWGNLKVELENKLDIDFENTKVRDYDTNHHYADSAAVLPEGQVSLLVSTDKNKSGVINESNYHKASYSDLRTFCKRTTGFGPNGKDLCLSALDKHYGSAAAPASKEKAAPKKAAPAKKAEKISSDSIGNRVSALESRVDALETKPAEKEEAEDGFIRAGRNLS